MRALAVLRIYTRRGGRKGSRKGRRRERWRRNHVIGPCSGFLTRDGRFWSVRS